MLSQELEDIFVTVLFLCLILTVTEILRAAHDQLTSEIYNCLAMETLFTFQLCLLTHELLLLHDVGTVGLPPMMFLVYAATVVHYWHASGVVCGFTVAIKELVRRRATLALTLQRTVAQMVGAFLAWIVARHVHMLGLTRLHSAAAQDCTSRLHTTRENGAAVEMGGTLIFHTVRYLFPHSSGDLHQHIVGITAACLVAAVGELTGALFNPALAFSVNFFCQGSSLVDNIFVYWLAPIAGIVLSVIIFDQLIPALRRVDE